MWAMADLERSVSMKLLAILASVLYVSSWGIALVSFIVGMVKDVMLGLKILGFGFAAVQAYVVIVAVSWVFFPNVHTGSEQRNNHTENRGTNKDKNQIPM
jgi:hypothetical protein